MEIQAVIFDLDGVIVTTDHCHTAAWERLAREIGVPVPEGLGDRVRGVSRMESLEITLSESGREFSPEEKESFAHTKNEYYKGMISALTSADILPGVMRFLGELRERGIKQAIGSSSRNTPVILERIGMSDYFDAVADGNDITRSKPDPEVFLLAARRMGMAPEACIVVEDAAAGVEAAVAAGMKVLAVGFAAGHPKADWSAPDLDAIRAGRILGE